MPDPLPPRRPGLLIPAGVAVALTLAVAGCTSDDEARPTDRSSEMPATTTTPSPTESRSISICAQNTDRGTGVAFCLPGGANGPVRSTRPGQDGTEVASRTYAAAEGDIRLSVSVLTTPDSPATVRSTVKAQYLPFLVVDTVRDRGGATDAGVVSNRRLRGVPYKGYDSQLTFTQKGRKAVWFTRAIELPRAVVVAQAVAYVPVDEDAADRVQATFRQLTDSLVIPS